VWEQERGEPDRVLLPVAACFDSGPATRQVVSAFVDTAEISTHRRPRAGKWPAAAAAENDEGCEAGNSDAAWDRQTGCGTRGLGSRGSGSRRRKT
jgi:hypothetical protein